MKPHDICAKHYDFIFKKRFGSAYDQLTSANLQTITDLLSAGKILDFGAGTGRIAIPLAQKGYEVVAVDASQGMLQELKRKADLAGVNITYGDSVSGFTDNSVDMVVSIFTVLAYITEEIEMDFALKLIWDSLKPGGLFLFDVVHKAGYEEICRRNNCITNNKQLPDFKELVKVELFDEDGITYGDYQENVKGNDNGEDFECTERFKIRFWHPNEIISKLEKELYFEKLSHFDFANADYYVFKKR